MSVHTDIDEPDWTVILRGVQDSLAARIHTSLPAIVRSYDSATQTAEVQLAVQLRGNDVPPLADVPVAWPGGAAGFVHVPLAAGDTVLVVFTEEDHSGWWSTGSVSAPRVLARHGLHAVAIPGLRPATAPLAVTGGHVTVAAAGAVHLGSDSASDAVALEPGLASVLGDFIDATKTVIAASLPAGIPAPASAAFNAAALAIQVRIAAGEMAATKVVAV